MAFALRRQHDNGGISLDEIKYPLIVDDFSSLI
jgi:hypothetical protein